jgi:predicted ABC-type sugar transport system permease subunit
LLAERSGLGESRPLVSGAAAAVGAGTAILASFSSLSINLQLVLGMTAMLLAGLLAARQELLEASESVPLEKK